MYLSLRRVVFRSQWDSFFVAKRNIVGPVAEVPPKPEIQITVQPGASVEKNAECQDGDSDISNPEITRPIGKDRGEPCIVNEIVTINRRSMTSSDTGVGSCGVAHQEYPERDACSVNQQHNLQTNGMLLTVTPATPSNIYQTAEDDNTSTSSQVTSVADKDTVPASIQADVGQELDPHRLSRISADIQGSVCVMNPEIRARGKRSMELKTAKRASYIIGVFSLCWLPLFVVS